MTSSIAIITVTMNNNSNRIFITSINAPIALNSKQPSPVSLVGLRLDVCVENRCPALSVNMAFPRGIREMSYAQLTPHAGPQVQHYSRKNGLVSAPSFQSAQDPGLYPAPSTPSTPENRCAEGHLGHFPVPAYAPHCLH